ncbi:rhodanese-like domain-containing protein [Pontibacter sp. E15-1]|uniref:rhodanese-like domain-containing protein n=1 Tax=Pontibacter sp. E15-1 TaxID=2919918 RepID=UPI001F501E29|nr:rhodanese-like domain-containing protein [Pontibacter sp. E15-1]MCJ8166676.1 rhodanese-like domain-containing protein [Pontibacter sp. E15-1]
MRNLLMIIPLAFILVLPACGQTTDKAYDLMLKGMYGDEVSRITPAQLHQQLQDTKVKPLLLDTRTPAEYRVSHLAGARFTAYNTFRVSQLQDVPKDARIVVYCSVGYRSERVGEKLKKAGYKNVQNLYGGIFEWVNEGYPVYNQHGKTNQVHAYSKAWGVWLQEGVKVYE